MSTGVSDPISTQTLQEVASIRAEESHQVHPVGPCIFVILGITGDLTKRLLFPALYNLAADNLLPEEFAVVGMALGDIDEGGLRDRLAADLRTAIGPDINSEKAAWLVSRVHFVRSAFDSPDGWKKLTGVLTDVGNQFHTGGNLLFYMATAPQFFSDLTQRLESEGLLHDDGGGWRRAIFEKPFGHDLDSAKELNNRLLHVAREDQIYRIDHYLGKETVQNILVFRFANGIFEPIWNRRYIDHVQISVAEQVGVELRGGYYEQTGALRDMIPNHLVQLLALTAMEPPSSFLASALQAEQVKALESITPVHPEQCATCAVRGQYTAGTINGTPVPAYRDEPNVNKASQTETYASLKMLVDNWRWAGVPFYLRTGKRMAVRKTEIAIQFRDAPKEMFARSNAFMPQANRLVMHIQPEENISLEFEAKLPGPVLEAARVEMKFCYQDFFKRKVRTGYETLLYDAMIGDRSLFKRADMIEAGWAIIQPVLDAWQSGKGAPLQTYAAGSEGPQAAVEMMSRDKREWRRLT